MMTIWWYVVYMRGRLLERAGVYRVEDYEPFLAVEMRSRMQVRSKHTDTNVTPQSTCSVAT
jgi:hypothetical protein